MSYQPYNRSSVVALDLLRSVEIHELNQIQVDQSNNKQKKKKFVKIKFSIFISNHQTF